MLRRERRANYKSYQELRRKANRICKSKKKRRMRKQTNLINSKRRKPYKALDYLMMRFQPRSNGCRKKDGEIIRKEEKVLQ
jgi:hypothetical protein